MFSVQLLLKRCTCLVYRIASEKVFMLSVQLLLKKCMCIVYSCFVRVNILGVQLLLKWCTCLVYSCFWRSVHSLSIVAFEKVCMINVQLLLKKCTCLVYSCFWKYPPCDSPFAWLNANIQATLILRLSILKSKMKLSLAYRLPEDPMPSLKKPYFGTGLLALTARGPDAQF